MTDAERAVLDALVGMWIQYCPNGHDFMSAGEDAFQVLDSYGLMRNDSEIDWARYTEIMR